ncbi:hypothetical protein [Streptomyces sp. NPDC049949]|uniref:hypothetical protein n=1 Tax=Streptomyces sp. NPDC049949 TaxID=3154627 RepID=UPI00343DE674
MQRENCSTQKHVLIEYLIKRGNSEYIAGFGNVFRDCWWGLLVWIALAAAVAIFLAPIWGGAVIGALIALSAIAFLVRRLRGHTVKCSAMGAVAFPLRIPEFL